HPAMFISLNLLGSMVLDVDGSRLDAKFIDNTGAIRDYFTLLKGASNAPNAPANLNAIAVSSQQIDLTWDDLSSNEEGFKIERSTDGAGFSQIATVAANTTSYSDSGLAAGSTYFYRVRAYNSGGNSPYSNTDSAATPGNLPAAPSNLIASAVSKSQINLSWLDNSNNEQGFRIERSTNGNSFTLIATVGSGVTSFANTGLKANKTYYYRVRAYNSAGNSAYSNVASAKTPRR
ncbi:MAG TPA: fibronectin type III domain-containing protein, partial [Acidobacteriota bacterium]